MEQDPAIQYLFSAARTKQYPDHILKHIKETGPVLGSEVYTKWDTLRAVDAKFGSLLTSHWKKKLLKDRRALLQKAWQGIPEVHRPEAGDGKAGSPTQVVPPREHVWPYINLADLQNKTSLTLYLESRIRQAPSVFATTEHIFMPTVEREPINIQLGRMRLHGRQNFGHVEDFEDVSSAVAFQLDAMGLSPAEGLMVLYVQNAILDFLLFCCKQMLPAGSFESLAISDKFDEESAARRTLSVQETMSDHAHVVATSPFRLRHALDISRVCHLISTQNTIAEMEIWQLREDPEYFASACQNYTGLESHHPLVNIHGDKAAKEYYTGLLSTSLGVLISFPHMMLITWDQLRSQSTMIRELLAEKVHGNAGKNILNDLRKAMNMFLVLLESVRKMVMVTVEQFESFAELRPFFAPSTEDRTKIEPRSALYNELSRSQVHKLLRALIDGQERNKATPFVETRFRLDQLDTWLRSNTDGWKWINTNVRKALTSLSVLAECSLEFELQAWYPKLASDLEEEVNQDPHYLDSLRSPAEAWYHIMEGYTGFQFTPSVGLGDPSDGKFDYPIRKGKNKKWVVEQMCVAEASLDKFWAMVDAVLEQRSDGHTQEALQRLLGQGEKMKRTKSWSERHEKWATDSQVKSAPSDLLYGPQPLSQTFHDSTKEFTGNFDKANISVKTKEKTRGKAAHAEDPVEDQRERSPDTRPKLKVKKKAHQTFAQLFHDPDTNKQEGGEVKWVDFVDAMTKVGFTAEQMHGSQWQFNPTEKLGLDRGIAFHQPHPGSTLTHEQARNCGARLNRAYGWDYSMFVRQ